MSRWLKQSLLALGVSVGALSLTRAQSFLDLYVDTDTGSGSTCSMGSPCATLLAAINTLPGTLTQPVRIYVEGATDDTGDVNQTPWDFTTTAANYLHIIGEQSPAHPNFSTSDSGKWTAGKYILTATNRNTFYNNIPCHIRVEGLQIENVESDTGGYIAFKLSNANQTASDCDQRANYLIIRGTRTTGQTIGVEMRPLGGGGAGTVKLSNLIVYRFRTGLEGEFAPTELYNSTLHANEFGIVTSATNGVLARNVIVSSSTGGDWINGGSWHASSSHNTGTDGSQPGSNGSTGTPSYVNTTTGSEDLHLQSGDTLAKNTGVTDPASGFFSNDIDGANRSGIWDRGADEEAAVLDPSVKDQEGYRWGVDNGNEASHTFEANQDTSISLAANQSRLLRVLINATGDPALLGYTLFYQKNSGGYSVVPVGTTSSFSITNQNVAASSDDAQQVGTTMTLTGNTIGASLDATTDWAGMRFTNIAIPAGATITSASVGVVPSASTEDEPLVTVFLENADDCATFTTTASDISNRSLTTGVSWSSTNLAADGATYFSTPSLVSDLQTVINRGGWASGNDLCVIIQGGATGTRDLTIEAQDLGPNTNPPRISIGWTMPNEVYIVTSANIAASGEATTARLTAPSGKSTSDFVCGANCRWDDENGTDQINITTDDYTEAEWPIFIASSAVAGDSFDFRVREGIAPFSTYSATANWTIPGGGGGVPIFSHYYRQSRMH